MILYFCNREYDYDDKIFKHIYKHVFYSHDPYTVIKKYNVVDNFFIKASDKLKIIYYMATQNYDTVKDLIYDKNSKIIYKFHERHPELLDLIDIIKYIYDNALSDNNFDIKMVPYLKYIDCDKKIYFKTFFLENFSTVECKYIKKIIIIENINFLYEVLKSIKYEDYEDMFCTIYIYSYNTNDLEFVEWLSNIVIDEVNNEYAIYQSLKCENIDIFKFHFNKLSWHEQNNIYMEFMSNFVCRYHYGKKINWNVFIYLLDNYNSYKIDDDDIKHFVIILNMLTLRYNNGNESLQNNGVDEKIINRFNQTIYRFCEKIFSMKIYRTEILDSMLNKSYQNPELYELIVLNGGDINNENSIIDILIVDNYEESNNFLKFYTEGYIDIDEVLRSRLLKFDYRIGKYILCKKFRNKLLRLTNITNSELYRYIKYYFLKKN